MSDDAAPDGRGAGRRHVFTVDVEEYFQVHAFEDLVHKEEWDCFPERVVGATDRLLELLDEADARGTFFVLGWVADRHPGLVRRIAENGHEVASHSYWHARVGELDPEEFRADARKSKDVLEQITGEPVVGYRAPSFSLVEGNEWMLEVLAEEGYRYDSSLFPSWRVGGEGYGGAPRHPHRRETPAGAVTELPLTTLEWGGLRFPAAGGAYFRHFPYALVRTALRRMAEEGSPGVFYVHPWELDPHQPVIPGSLTARVRHYRNLDRTEARLRRLLADFAFTSARESLGLATEEPPGPGDTPGAGDAGDVGRETRSRRVGS